jgi:hypothetical protein
MRRLAAVVAVLFVSGSAAACGIDEVAGKIQFAAITRAAELATQQTFLLKKFGEIGERAKDPNKSLNQQLSQADLAEFTQTQTRYQSIELLQLLESNYSRDNQVVRDFYQVAQADYIGTPTPKEGEKNYLPYAFLAVMTMASQDQQIQDNLVTTPETKGCTLEAALDEIEQESLGRLERLPLAQASKELTAIQMRSGGGKVDPDKLNGSDRAIFDRIQRTAYAPANREKNFITNIESLKLLARSASLKYELGKKDAVDSGGDINAVGKSAGALNLDERAKMGFGMLDKIADKYPSDWFIQKQKMAPVIDAIKKQDAARMSKKK